MKQQIAIGLALVTVFLAAPVTDLAYAQGLGMPHEISVKFEPSYVSVGDTVNVVATFVPCVDIESLNVVIWLPPKVRVDSTGGNIRGWRERARKGEAVVISGRAVFPKPGLYLVEVVYWHPDPRRHYERRIEVRNFRFLIPGGILTPRPKDEVPIRAGKAREGTQDESRDGRLLRSRVQPHESPAKDSTVRKYPNGARGDPFGKENGI